MLLTLKTFFIAFLASFCLFSFAGGGDPNCIYYSQNKTFKDGDHKQALACAKDDKACGGASDLKRKGRKGRGSGQN